VASGILRDPSTPLGDVITRNARLVWTNLFKQEEQWLDKQDNMSQMWWWAGLIFN
jgi:hypothetical protein